ncbi:uncharacterized protein CIMG_13428 [Coccidioides immitis RS]|uniref:Uncharacterized protein n=1 Tax=Coccidioides immitis (strain RS) TaxID=246410 RepID=A0A0E1S3R3_COCIM|nr:uncharacterized protein CIMG_13428 [Coccidioides immitis RS]EAS34131.2 hypothetical protein CIMG_13428 [Coccidioides immitis RS]
MLMNEVIKALQEISVILKEIQKIQEMNFIAVSDIKNALYLKCSFDEQPKTGVTSSHDDAEKNNAKKNDAENKNANNKNANEKDANKKGAKNEKADANVTSDVSSEGFQNWFFSQGDL